ncbi:hypothetical protein FCV25MIE_29831 [Fagus crenata]
MTLDSAEAIAVLVHGSSSTKRGGIPKTGPNKPPTGQAANPPPIPPETGSELENPPENQEFEMEVEPNPGFTNQGQFQNPIPKNFESWLREIDQAINYFPLEVSLAVNKTPQVNSLLIGQENPPRAPQVQHGPPLINGSRGILEDISNDPRPNTNSPNLKTVKWKKLARA